MNDELEQRTIHARTPCRLLISLAVGGLVAGHAQGKASSPMSFHHPLVSAGAEQSLVSHVESAIIIPGDTHEDLWVHPNLVTIPGSPMVIEISLRSTDRRGGDRHTRFNFFQTQDDFRTLEPIDAPTAPAWNRIGMTPENFSANDNDGIELPKGEWHWARNSVCLDAHTIIYPFLVRHGERRSVRTVTARRKGKRFAPQYLSNALTNSAGRGLLEPQIAAHGGQHYMTMRAEDGCGYVSVSDDNGRSWNEPHAWRWDDGNIIAMHTTMTKLLAHSDGLLLVYTRIRDDNRHVFRARAPLHCADVDPETLVLRRATERILIPDNGLPVGNFWVWPIDRQKSYVAAAEWPRDGRTRNGDAWLARIYWKQPNRLMTEDGREAVRSAPPAPIHTGSEGRNRTGSEKE